MRIRIVFTVLLVLSGATPAADLEAEYAARRAALMEEVRSDIPSLRHVLKREKLSPEVDRVMSTVPRHEFVPAGRRPEAYENRPLPIGHGQTISQPLIVALMTDLMDVGPQDRVLEVGTGSGYQAAVLSPLVREVYSIEIIPALNKRATRTLKRLGYDNVHTRAGDGYNGWPEAAPFDAIMVTAAGDHVPPPLVEQLKPGGHLVLPVGSRYAAQQLLVVSKQDDGTVTVRSVLPVRFVPLTGGH